MLGQKALVMGNGLWRQQSGHGQQAGHMTLACGRAIEVTLELRIVRTGHRLNRIAGVAFNAQYGRHAHPQLEALYFDHQDKTGRGDVGPVEQAAQRHHQQSLAAQLHQALHFGCCAGQLGQGTDLDDFLHMGHVQGIGFVAVFDRHGGHVQVGLFGGFGVVVVVQVKTDQTAAALGHACGVHLAHVEGTFVQQQHHAFVQRELAANQVVLARVDIGREQRFVQVDLVVHTVHLHGDVFVARHDHEQIAMRVGCALAHAQAQGQVDLEQHRTSHIDQALHFRRRIGQGGDRQRLQHLAHGRGTQCEAVVLNVEKDQFHGVRSRCLRC